jgi:hypothetical protein
MVTREELLQCSIGQWYDQYEKHTFPTMLVPLPEEFVAWLLEDGLFLPASNSAVSCLCRDYVVLIVMERQ